MVSAATLSTFAGVTLAKWGWHSRIGAVYTSALRPGATGALVEPVSPVVSRSSVVMPDLVKLIIKKRAFMRSILLI
jgi:hypothetical protein